MPAPGRGGTSGRRRPADAHKHFDPHAPVWHVDGFPWLALALLACAPLTGCLGGGGDAAASPLLKARAEVTATTGGIEGVVTDNVVQPIQDAVVSLLETGATAATASDGSYALSGLVPGAYTVRVEAAGYLPVQSEVVVLAAQVAIFDAVIVRLMSDEAYVGLLELAGFIECTAGWGWEFRPELGGPLATVDQTVNSTTGTDPRLRERRTLSWERYGLAVCAVPNIVFENTTNDRFIQPFDGDPPIHGLVYALDWDDPAGQARSLWTIMEVFPFYNTPNSYLIRKIGPSPLEHRLERAHFESVQANFTARCEEGSQNYCGLSFFDDGWPLVLRVFAYWNCLNDRASFCVPIQQAFTHYVQIYYNAPPPADASAVPRA